MSHQGGSAPARSGYNFGNSNLRCWHGWAAMVLKQAMRWYPSGCKSSATTSIPS